MVAVLGFVAVALPSGAAFARSASVGAQAATSVAVTSSRNPSYYGDAVIFTATVTPVAPGMGTPSGSVQFTMDGTDLGTVSLTGGVATVLTAAPASGNHSVVANYSGDALFQAASGSLPGGQTAAVAALADLGVTQSGPAGSLIDLPTTYVIVVTNSGPNDATEVVVTDLLPDGWTLSPSPGCSTTLPTITCTIGNLAVGSQATVALVVVPHTSGAFTNTASVNGRQSDFNNKNNSASVTTQVMGHGYWLFGSDGGVFTFGGASFFGSTGSMVLNKPVVAMTPTPSRQGYWLFASDGGVFSFGDAGFFGSTASSKLNAPIVAMACTPTGHGYWLFAADGGVFAYGDAGFAGSAGGSHLNAPIVAMAPAPSGHGYWMVAADGGVFPFGDAGSFGSLGGQHLKAPIVGIAATPSGQGYWLVASDGGVFTFGDAAALGSLSAAHLASPVVGVAATAGGHGYWLVSADGGVFSFGDAPFLGGMGAQHLNKRINGLTSAG